MKILVSGGQKTANIVGAIKGKFDATGDAFIIEQFIDGIENIYTRGDYFDKAIITEQSITNEYTITDEDEIRHRINDFANACVEGKRKALYVFLTQTREFAALIYDEILPIIDTSAVVCKAPPYNVQFFVDLVLKDVKQISKDILFVPDEVTSDMGFESSDFVGDDEDAEEEQNFDFEESSFDGATSGEGDFAGNFGGGFSTANDYDENDLGGDEQFSEPASFENPDDFGNDQGFSQGTPNNEFDGSDAFNDDQGFGDNFGDDQGFDNSFGDDQGYDSSDYSGFDADDYANNEEQNPGMNDSMNAGAAGVQAGAEAGMSGGKGKDKAGIIGKFLGRKPNGQQVPQQPSQNIGGYNPPPVQRNQAATPLKGLTGKGANNVSKATKALIPFSKRGTSICVTGFGGSGTSTIAYNLANIICQLGFTVLLVDLDVNGRTQNYIAKPCYEGMETDGANLRAAINSSTGISSQVSLVKVGFHLLTMGIGADTAPVEEMIHKEKITRFINNAKSGYNFVIYDVPFNTATTYLSEVVYNSDNLVLAVDASTWGIAKMMLGVCNISNEDMQDTMFRRAQVVFNKQRKLHKVFGKSIRSAADIMKVVDQQVLELIGDDPGFYFKDMTLSGIIDDDPNMEDGWFDNVQYSDTRKGQNVFLELLQNIVLHK